MDGATFVERIIAHLAWPVAVVTLAFMMKTYAQAMIKAAADKVPYLKVVSLNLFGVRIKAESVVPKESVNLAGEGRPLGQGIAVVGEGGTSLPGETRKPRGQRNRKPAVEPPEVLAPSPNDVPEGSARE